VARCPFAIWDEVSGSAGAPVSGPFRIVHHTTEGSSYAGARAAYAAKRSDPHFTVSGAEIHQHIDTSEAARALKNASGGVETNRASAIQIEVVSFAGQPKDVTTLQTVAQLCRWIEDEHGIPQNWPNGHPRWSTNGQNPGGHNRNAATWAAEGGHYGHSQVPENSHWDPGYTPVEVALVTPSAVFDAHEALAAPAAEMLESVEARPSPDSAEAIATRLIERLADVSAAARQAGATRAHIRVVKDSVEVTLTVDLDTTKSSRVAGSQSAKVTGSQSAKKRGSQSGKVTGSQSARVMDSKSSKTFAPKSPRVARSKRRVGRPRG
jgi:hypothetical protein